MPKNKADLLQGTLDMLILKTLARSGEMHGFEIAEADHRRVGFAVGS